MKKVISIMCIVLMVLGIILPQISYANELEENIIQNEKVENNIESNGDENKEESNTVENVIDDQEIVNENQNTIEDEITDETTENIKEEIDNEESTIIEPESTQENMVKSIEAGSLKLAEGIYTIRSVLPGNRAVGIDAGSKEDGANVNIWDYYGVGQQKFRLRIDSEGYYEIENIRSNKLLNVDQETGMNVNQYSTNGGLDNQKWIIEKGTEAYKIKSKLNGWYLNLENGVGANGENVNIEEGAEVRTQEFLIERIDVDGTETVQSGTTNKIITKLSGRAVGVDGGRTENGADINLWDYERVDQQRFKFVYNEEGYYTIENIKSGKLLNVVGADSESGTQVEQWEEQPSNEGQKWIVQDVGNGYYSIISKLNGLYLTVGGNGANCDLMYVENPTGGDNQKFQIIESGVPQGEKIVEEGTYKIVLANAPTQSLTVENGSTADGANVHIWEYKNNPQQQFELVYDDDGYYEIIPVHSGKRLDVVGYGNESNVDQWSDNGGNDNQKWVIRKSKAGNYNIVSKRDSLYLDAYQSRTENGTNIEVYEQSGGNGQEFKLEKIENPKTVEEGTYKIVLANAPTQSLTVDGGKTEDGANVHIWEYVDSLQQQFNLVYDGQGYYEIIPLNSGKRLDVVGYGNEANVDQWANNGGNDNQKWAIRKSQAGNYNIISKRDSLYLDAYQSKTENGTNIQVYEQSGGNGQEFKLEKIEDKSEKTVTDGTYQIAPQANTNLVMEVSASSMDNDGRVQIWEDFNAKGQKVKLEYIDGYYRISFAHSGKCLTVKNRNISSGEQVVQYEWNEGDNQKWVIRDNGDGSIGILPLTNQDLTLDIFGDISNGSGIELYNNEKNVKQRFCLLKTGIGVNIDSNKYPGIAEAVDKLLEQHPEWQFEVLYTGIDFYTAVQGEYEHYTVDSSGKRQYANLVDTNVYKGDWIAPNPAVTGNWAQASYNGIAYFMDPRNFLNDTDAFQFVDLSDYYNSGATLESIQYQVNGTFLNNFAEDVRISCEHQNVNPYYIIARLFQEQGKNGSATIYMDGGDGKQYFNPFNIGAVNGNDVATALSKAKEQGWDSMQKGIEGGISFIRQNYLDANQNTLYLNKFDVNPNSPGGFYTHQYMQNLSAAYSEARTFRGAYVDTGTLDNTIKFIIPVYENMPTSPAAKPTGQNGGNTGYPAITDQGPKNVQVYDIQTSLIVRTGPGTQYAEFEGERLQNGTVLLSVERYENGWQKVVTPSGKVGYCSGDYLQFINDVTNCNERVAISTTGSVNIRIGPGTDFASLGTFRDGTTGTRILKGVYTANGYTWDLVILDDGTKGFVASNYLRII